MSTKIITIANHKGGVGKTTSTASIGSALAIRGKKVLLIDLDAQQNLSFTLTQNEDPERSVYDALVASDELFIPLTAEALPLQGLTMPKRFSRLRFARISLWLKCRYQDNPFLNMIQKVTEQPTI